MGVDPAMFSQAFMFHAHRYSKGAWAGEPETDPSQDYDEPVEGWELTPQECLDLAYGGVLREKSVLCGTPFFDHPRLVHSNDIRLQYSMHNQPECSVRTPSGGEVSKPGEPDGFTCLTTSI